MTKYDFKLRRGVFRSGNIRTQRNFSRFERGFMSRKRTHGRLRLIILIIAVIILLLMFLFTINIITVSSAKYQPKVQIENTNQLL